MGDTLSLRDHQIVLHREYAGDGVGAEAGGVLVGGRVDDACQSDVSITDQDADGLDRGHGVFLKGRIAVDGAIQLAAEAIE